MAGCLNGSGGHCSTGRLTGWQAGRLVAWLADKKALDKHCDTLLSKLMKIFHNSDKRTAAEGEGVEGNETEESSA